MPNRALFSTMLYLLLLSSACGDSENPPRASTLVIEGTATVGTAAPKRLELQLSLVAASQAAQDPACQRPRPLKQGASSRQATTEDGSYSIRYQPSEVVDLTDADCALSRFSVADIQSLRVDASVETDVENCAAFCRESTDPKCLSECSGPDRELIATTRLSQQDILANSRLENDELTISVPLRFDTLGPAVSDSALPDLVVRFETTAESVGVTSRNFDAGSCALDEGCVAAPGTRRLLVFDAEIQNLGGADLRVGIPEVDEGFEYSACHEHFHSGGLMDYELVAPDSRVVAAGRKQGFCIMDTRRLAGDAPGGYDCDFQGITTGWSDVYDRMLDCQWIDVTGVPPGDYALRLQVNRTGRYEELDHENNTVEIPVTIPVEGTPLATPSP